MYKGLTCRDHQKGSCERGDSCKYYHEESNQGDRSYEYNNRPALEMVRKLQLTRKALSAWMDDPEVEEIIKGSYVRVIMEKQKGGGVAYRIAEVMGMTTDIEYKLNSYGKTNKYLILQYGDQVSICKVDRISNNLIGPPEFDAWLAMMEICGVPVLTSGDASYKLRKVKTYIELCQQDMMS
eukprot:NODE_8847_length_641_cov_38.164093_g8222_i0.p1 GENE.NODE_8847_length_641_cov_38.164093_g8222_i0~~NODE_8847_length_641_cov_38.164093_g8222_i0.p1  ORF type:complete len:181 (-),score=26.80 NODE_8847_length_641_cov_38.164093_g8222_i0:45-587(-)